MKSMVALLAENAAKYPEKLFVVDKKGTLSYSDAWMLTRRYAYKLKSLGVEKGSFVLLECTQNRDFLLLDFACELVHAIFVPVEYKASITRVKEIENETEATLLLSETSYAFRGQNISIDQFVSETSTKELKNFEFPELDEIAEILYTTGTTGKSKGIEITHRNNYALAENVKYGVEMNSDNVELLPLPISHSHGLRCCYANLLNCSTIILTEGVAAVANIFDLMEQYHVTSIDLSPTAVLILMRLTKGKLSRFRDQIDYIQVGTAVLQETEKNFLKDTFPKARLYNFYGSTESGRSCVFDFNHIEKDFGCIGVPTKNSKIIITDENREIIKSSKNNMGLLAFYGDMNMKGYFKQPELTKKIMCDGCVYTNDIGYVDEDGYVYMLGRKDDVINCNGIKIAPEEIEDIVHNMEMIEDCACVPMQDEISGQAPKLFIQLKSDFVYDKIEFRRLLSGLLEGNKMPKEIAVLDCIPRTSNGKLIRRSL